MTQTGSTALTVVAWIALSLAATSALVILVRIAAGDREPMAVMNRVWPITALYWGAVALWAYLRRDRHVYLRHGRSRSSERMTLTR